jgi:hypothetical protein
MFGTYDWWIPGTLAALAPLLARAARRDPGACAAIRDARRQEWPYDWPLVALAVATQPPRRRHNNEEETP